MSCCRVESTVGFDERGQMVLPKDIRERAKILAGDKQALVSMEKKLFGIEHTTIQLEGNNCGQGAVVCPMEKGKL